MIINKGNGIAPNSFENRIDQGLFVGTMVPLAEITCAIRVFRRRFHLNVVHTTFALETLVRVTFRVLVQREQITQFAYAKMSFHIFLVVDHTTAQRLLVRLALKYLLFQSARGKQTVNETLLPLAISPHTRHGLIVIGRIPIGIEHYKTIGANQVQTTTTCFGREHKYEVITVPYKADEHNLGEIIESSHKKKNAENFQNTQKNTEPGRLLFSNELNFAFANKRKIDQTLVSYEKRLL
jgi:hypothetical protein